MELNINKKVYKILISSAEVEAILLKHFNITNQDGVWLDWYNSEGLAADVEIHVNREIKKSDFPIDPKYF